MFCVFLIKYYEYPTLLILIPAFGQFFLVKGIFIML